MQQRANRQWTSDDDQKRSPDPFLRSHPKGMEQINVEHFKEYSMSYWKPPSSTSSERNVYALGSAIVKDLAKSKEASSDLSSPLSKVMITVCGLRPHLLGRLLKIELCSVTNSRGIRKFPSSTLTSSDSPGLGSGETSCTRTR